MESKFTLYKNWKILFFFFIMLCCSYDAEASHLRGGTISQNCLGGTDVQFTLTVHWGGNFGLPAVGDVSNNSMNFSFGDGSSIDQYGTVTFVNVADDYYTTVATFTHTYLSAGQYTALASNCCRISSLPNGWSDDDFDLTTIVNAGVGCNGAPSLATPTFINIPPGSSTFCFQLNASDPENDPISFSIGTGSETGLYPDPSTEWPAGTISSSGLLCINPTTAPGAPGGGYPDGTLIPIPIKVTDNVGGGTTPGDIILKISAVTGVAPTWDYSGTPANGSTITLIAGIASNINVKAEDADSGNTIDINPSGVPQGAVFTPGLPNTSSPNITTMNWTPTAADVGSYPITLIAQDNTGLQTSTSFTINVLDCMPPVAMCQDVTVTVDDFGLLTLDASVVGNESTATCGQQSLTVWPNSFDCDDVGSTFTVDLTITDIYGDSDLCTAQVTVVDSIPPTPVCDLSATTTLSSITGVVNVFAFQMNKTSIDNCTSSGDLIFSYSGTDINDNFRTYDCENIGFNDVSIWVWDEAGNVSEECSAILQVVDNTAPVCMVNDITVSLNHHGADTITAADIDNGTYDHCGVEFLSLDISTFDCDDIDNSPIVVTMTAVDSSGNTSNCEVNVTVQDAGHVHVHCQDATVQLNEFGNGILNAVDVIVPGSLYDNCGIADTVVSPNTFTCSDIGSTVSVTLTVTDINGNSVTCTSEITVEDNVPPVADCKDIIVTLDANGMASIADDAINNNSTDACGIASISIDKTTFGCADVGSNEITLTVVDINGNSSTCTANAEVLDNTTPTAICQDVTIQLDASGVAILSASDLDNGSFDECGIAYVCIGKGVETLSLSGELSNTDPTFTWEADSDGPQACFYDDNVFYGSLSGPFHHYDQALFTITGPDTYTFALNDINGGTDFNGIIYDSEFNPLAICDNIIYGDDDSNSAGGVDPLIVVSLTMAPGDYILVTSTYGSDPLDDPAPYTWDITSLSGGSVSEFGCAPSLEYGCDEIGDNTVTLTVTDVNGNVSYCSSTVTVEDNVAPEALCASIIAQLDDTGNATITAADVDGGSSDACGIASISVSPSTFTCAEVGTNTVVLTVTDTNGNESTCSSTVTVEDNVAPEALCASITAQLDDTGNATITAADVDGGSSDTCGIASMSVSPSAFTCAEVGANTVVLTVTDTNGNESTCEATVTVEDNVAPEAICQDITVDLDFNGNVTITGVMIDGGSTDACGILSLGAGSGTTDLDCSSVGPNTITLTVTDNNGNTAQCDATVTVEDNVAPLVNCLNIVEVPLNIDGNGFVTKGEVTGATFDACGVVNTFIIRNDDASHPDYGIENEMLFFDCDDIGLVDVMIRAYDANGNLAECNTAVNVKDEALPIMECTSAMIYLDANGVAALDSNALDNGSYDNCAIVEFSVSQTDFDCSHLGLNLITMTAEDEGGNTSSCTNGVMVLDTIKPTPMCMDITVQLDATGNVSITGADIDGGSTDNCSIVSMTASPNSFACADLGSNTVTFTVEDESGNMSTCTATVTVEDNVAPTALCKAFTVQLDAYGAATISAGDVDNGSNDACGIAYMSVSPSSLDCSNIGDNTVTLTVTDINGNMGTCDATVTVEDNVAPTALCKAFTVQLDASGVATISAADVDNGSNDVCGIAYMSVSPSSLDCSNVGANTVTLTVTDNNGNMSTCDATVTVEDNVAPTAVCAAFTVQLDASGAATISAADVDNGSNDACGIAYMSVSPSSLDCSNIGDNTVTLTVTDINGNMGTCDATVTVEDNVAPTALCKAFTVQLDASGVATISAADVDNGSNDACGITTMSVSPSAFTCAEVGVNTVTLTVTDNNGNASTCEAAVTVEDNVDPEAICMNITVELDANGVATIDSNAVDGGSSDACGIASFSTDLTSFDCSHLGDNTVEMTVTDVNGNDATCTATVTVIDVTGPELTCPDDIIVNTLPSDCNQNVIMPTLFPTDVCTGTASYEYEAVDITFVETGTDTFALFPVGVTEVTVIATDGFGNTSECTFNVSVIDNVDPVIVGCDVIGDITVDTDMAQCGANVTWDETLINANDNCSGQGVGVIITSDYNSGDLFPIGTTTVTYTVADDAGNTAECSFDVTVNPALPLADFTSLTTSLSVIFTNESVNATTYSWDFGDNNTSTDVNPSHAYATAGTYNVCLIAENACGDMNTYCEDVTVANTGECLDVVSLNPGWNLISFDVDPTDNSIATVFADEISSGNLLIVTGFNASGAVIFDPLLPPFLNTLQNIEPGYGYWVQMNNASSLSLVGDCIDVDLKIDLTTGWNLVSYIPQSPTTPQVYFADLIANGWLDLVTGYNGGSQIYDPSFPIPALNTLTDLENGFGYWVKVNTDVAAGAWLKGNSNSSSTRNDENLDNWGNLRTSSYDFLSGTVDGIQDGERINVVNEFGDLIIELEVIQGGYLKLTPLYGDDSDTPDEIDGLIFDQTLYFEYKGIQSETSIDFKGSSKVHFVDLEFESSTTDVTELTYDLSANLAPNPMFNATTLSLEIPQTGVFTIQLFDMTGKQVRSIHNAQINAGYFETTIERNDLIGGQYIISVMGDRKDSHTRIPLLVIN